MTEPEIRPATPADGATVLALLMAQFREHRIATPEPRVARALAYILGRPHRGRILIATEGKRVVGVAALSFTWPLEHGARASWLEELYVTPDRRGHGIGSALLSAACRAAAAAGVVAIDLEVDADHQRAAALYARAGFQPLPRARWVLALTGAAAAGVTGKPPSVTDVAADTATHRAPEAVVRDRHSGGCFCGAVRYHAAAAPVEVSHCHCSICRRASGAPFVTWATFAVTAFTFTSGTPAELRATPHAVRTFCARCGTALTFRENARPNLIDVTVGSCDAPDALAPGEHIWTSSRLAWLHIDDDLPCHPENDPAEFS